MPENIKFEESGEKSTVPPAKITLNVPSSPPPAESGANFSNIFTQTQAKEKESKVITSILSQKDLSLKTKPILGPAPTLEKTLEQEKEQRLKRKLRLAQFSFLLVFIAGVASSFYFYSELSPSFDWFGSNTTARLTDTNTRLRKAQTDFEKFRYMAAQLNLNEFSYQADRFFSSVTKMNNPAISDFDKRTIAVDLDEAQKALPILLSDIRSSLTADVVIPTFRSEAEPEMTQDQILTQAQGDLRNALLDERKNLGQNPTNAQDILDLKLIDNTIKLIGNTRLTNILQQTSADAFQKDLSDYAKNPDAQKLQALQTTIGNVLSSTKSDLATIANIKQTRIQWSNVISWIKEQTQLVDPNFDQQLLYETIGGIVYSGYEFEATTNKIVLSGVTKTTDASNFTLMSKLINQLESSQYFENVDMRSFSKSKSGTGATGGYLANFKIDLALQAGQASNKDTGTILQQTTLKSAAPSISRTTAPSTTPPAVTQTQTAAPLTEQALQQAQEQPATQQPPVLPAESISSPAPSVTNTAETQQPSAGTEAAAPVSLTQQTEAPSLSSLFSNQ